MTAASLIDRGAGRPWQRIRLRVLARDRHQCVVCGSTDGLQVDHVVERRFGGGDDMANLQTLCAEHHRRKTAANYRRRNVTQRDEGFYGEAGNPRPPTVVSLPPKHAGATLTGEESAGKPRFWPEPHPDAVGTRGGELAEYAAEVIGQPLLPWQAALADELLAVDAEGRWIRSTAMILVPRQSGKSTLIRALCEWLASQGQVVITTSAKLQNVAHLMRPTQLRVRSDPAYRVLFSKEQNEVCWPGWDEDGYRWIGQAANNMLGRGFTAATAVIDEVQDVGPDALEAVSPAQTEIDNPLTVMTGTAPRGDSPLLLAQRELALQGGPVALFEWSAPPGSDWRDEETWRACSPRWTPARLRHIRKEVQTQPEHYIRSEYLCQPVRGGVEPWLDFAAWERARRPLDIPDSVQVAAVEDGRGGMGGSVALAWSEGGTPCVVGWTTPSLAEAWREASRAEKVTCGITLRNEPQAKELGAKPSGRRETATALPELRRLLEAGLAWDGDELDTQMRKAAVREDSTGSLTVGPSTPSGVMRAAAWAVQAVRVNTEPVFV